VGTDPADTEVPSALLHRPATAPQVPPGRRGRRRLIAGPVAVLAIGLVAFGFFAGFSGTSSATQPIVSQKTSVLEEGQYLFDEHCSSCHGAAGVGSTRAPSLEHAGAAAADFYLITGRMPLNAAGDQAMQHSPLFTTGQIEALVSYVADLPRIHGTFPGPAIPSILPLCSSTAKASGANPNCVTLSYGQQTYALNCAQCHQIGGAGGILANGMIVPSLKAAPPLVVAEAMRVGPQPMPRFGTGQLDERQLSAVVHYVMYLHHPEDRGGLSISGFGPVAEGFVGILVGLGVLLFVARMIGTRA
jgi:ubiquinol-cytochrome c reductase cytochrome c subunit